MTIYYVTMTWHDWPEGGSFGTVVEAQSYADAETLCRDEMASTYAADNDADDYHLSKEEVIEGYSHDWHLVDCFDLEEFIKQHAQV
jgi:hypothetical protein